MATKRSVESGHRPLIHFQQPQSHGPGWNPADEAALADDPEDPYRRHKPRKNAAGHDTSATNGVPATKHETSTVHQEQDHARMHNERQSEREARHRKRRKARELVHDILTVAGEFVGTFLFLLLAFMGAQSATFNRGGAADATVVTNDNQTILFIALSFGMSLVVVAWAFFRITGSAFNPAVSFSLYLIGGLSLRRAIGSSIAQIVGGIAAAAVAKGITIGTFATANALTAQMNVGQGLAVELFTTALLVFTVLMCAAEKSKATFLAPVAIGLALFVGHLASIGWTGAGINPARSLGPWIVNGDFPGNAWFYIVGQYVGALLATLVYVMLKHLDYAEVVGDIETDDKEASATVANAPMTTLLNAMPGVHIDDTDNTNDAASLSSRSNVNAAGTPVERDLEAGLPLESERTTSSDTHVVPPMHENEKHVQ